MRKIDAETGELFRYFADRGFDGHVGNFLHTFFDTLVQSLGLEVIEIAALLQQLNQLGVIDTCGVVMYNRTAYLNLHFDRRDTWNAFYKRLEPLCVCLIASKHRAFNPQPARDIMNIIVHRFASTLYFTPSTGHVQRNYPARIVELGWEINQILTLG